VGAGHAGSQGVLRLPAGAGVREDERGVPRLERRHGGLADRLECRPTQVEAPDDSAYLLHPGEPRGVANEVDDAGVTAAGEDDQRVSDRDRQRDLR
jgi:hypothetical protein